MSTASRKQADRTLESWVRDPLKTWIFTLAFLRCTALCRQRLATSWSLAQLSQTSQGSSQGWPRTVEPRLKRETVSTCLHFSSILIDYHGVSINWRHVSLQVCKEVQVLEACTWLLSQFVLTRSAETPAALTSLMPFSRVSEDKFRDNILNLFMAASFHIPSDSLLINYHITGCCITRSIQSVFTQAKRHHLHM